MGLLNKIWSQADFWEKEENKRQAQAVAKPMPARAPQPQQNVIQRAAPTGLRAGLGAAAATLPGATPAISAYKLLDRTKPGKAVIAGAKRSGIGTGQALSGLYDLATPGTGTNRISKTLDQQAKQTDQSVKDQRLNPILYKGGQLGGDIATGMGAGGAAKWAGRGLVKAAPVLSNVPKAVSAIETGVTKAVTPMASKNLGGRIVAKTVQNVANPKYQGVNALYTAQQTGKDASQGKQITRQRVATDAAVGGLVFPAAGAIAGQTARAAAAPVVKAARNAHLIRPTNLNDTEVARLSTFVDNRGTNGMTEQVYNNGVAAAQKAGLSPYDVSAIDRVIGDHMTFNTRQAVRKETLQNIKDRFSTPLNEGGYVKLPAKTKNIKQAVQEHPEVKTFIKDYADMLKGMEDGVTGGDLIPDGSGGYRRTSAHSQFYRDYFAQYKRKPSKQAYLEHAREQLESGKADSYAVEEFNRIKSDVNNPELQSLYAMGEQGQFGKQPVGEIFSLPTPKKPDNLTPGAQTLVQKKLAQSGIAQSALPQNTTVTPQQSGKRPEILNAPLPIDTKGFDAPNNLSLDKTVAPLGKSVERALNDGAPIKDKALNTRLSNSSKLPEPLKQMLDGTYVVQDNKTTIKHAKDLIWRSPQEAEIRALSPKNAVDVQIGVELFNKYANEGNFSKAVDFVNASDSTNAGQMIQILSQYDRTTPEGAVRFATAAIKRFNETHKGEPIALTEQHIKQIVDHAKAIQQMPQGRERNIESQKLMQVINELMPSSKTDKAIAVWKAGLLTSPRTHLRNILGNTVHGIAEAAKDPIAAANDIFLKTFKTKNRSMSATLKGSVSGAKEGASIAREVIKTGFDPTDDITKFDVQRVNWGKSRTQRAAKAYTEAVFRTLGAEDKVFYHSALNRSLYDQAITQAKNEGRRADAGYIKQLVSDPSPTMLETAVRDASIATFKDRNMLTELASNSKRIARKNGVTNAAAEMMMPFTGVPSSVAGQMVAYSPIGLVKGLTKDVRILAGKIKPGDIPTIQRQASQEVGRGVLGSGMLAIGAMLTNTGQMTGQPKDAEEARLWAAQGKQPNSVMIGGKWRSINSVGPEALIALAGSKISEGGKSASEKGANIIKDFMSQTFLQGIQGPMNSINDPGRYAESYLTNQFASGIPNFVKDVARATDNTQRDTKGDGFIDTVKNNIKASIPGQRNDLLPKRDVIGNTMPQEPTGFNAFIDIGNSKTPRSNPVVNELNRLYQTDNGATPSQLKNKQTIAKNKVILDVAQLNELEQKSGGAFSQEMAALMQTDSYKKADDATKADAVKKLSAAVRKQAKLDLFHAGGLQAGGGYEQSSDAPKDVLGRASLYAKAAIKDPVQNAPNIAKGIFTSERARKLTGNTLILERKKGLSTMDGGNKNAQVDHKIALAIGGDNAKGNFQYLSNEDNNKKGQYETKLMKQLADKKINRAEAIRLSKEYAANLATVKPGGDTASKPIDVTKGAIKSLGGKTSGTGTMSADYETALESYKKNEGKMSAAQKIRAEGKLARLKVGKDYNKDAVSLYSVNKNELATYLALEEKGKDKKKLAEQIMAYDQALYEAGLISKPKFKYGISSSGGGRSSGSSSGSRKGTRKSTKVANIIMPTYSTANRKMQSALKSTRSKA